MYADPAATLDLIAFTQGGQRGCKQRSDDKTRICHIYIIVAAKSFNYLNMLLSYLKTLKTRLSLNSLRKDGYVFV